MTSTQDLTDVKVTQANKLVEAAHTLTLNEKRLILACVAQLDPRRPAPMEGLVRLTAEQFANAFQLETKHSYEALADAAKRLYHRDIRRYAQGKVVQQMRWVSYIEYFEGVGCVALGFEPRLLPYLTELHREFTSYQLRQIGGLKSFYAIRFYELLTAYRNVGHRDISLEQLRETLELTDKYASVKDLRRWVIDPSIQELNAHTDLRVSYTPQRNGRKVLGFTFSIDHDPQAQLL